MNDPTTNDPTTEQPPDEAPVQACGHPWQALVWLTDEDCLCSACVPEVLDDAPPPAAGEGEA